MKSQSELFKEFPSALSPHSHFDEVRVDEKIIPVPYSLWKGGRMRGD